MFNYKFRLFVVLIAICHFNAQAQRVDFLSPQAADFVKYGNITPSLYTGQIGLSIPLVEAKDNEFKAAVSLNYNSSGFMPGRPSGPVGLNWYLSAGGSITRKVNSAPDDSQGFNVDHTSCPLGCTLEVPTGFYEGINTFGAKDRDAAFNFQAGAANANVLYWYMGYDYQPDEFTFNFMGHSGRFYIHNDGTVKVLSDEHLIVDVSQLSSQPVTVTQFGNALANESQIAVTTSDGYKYYFGGAVQSLEYSYPLTGDTGTSDIVLQPVINTWNLTKIISPEGKQLTFTYVSHDPSIDPHHRPVDHNHWILSQYAEEIQSYSTLNGNVPGDRLQDVVSLSIPSTSWSVTKTSYLASITSDNFTVNFVYSPKSSTFYANSITPGGFVVKSFDQQNLKLDEIDYLNSSQTLIKKVNFNYTYDNTSTRLILFGLAESGKSPYHFDYYQSTFPVADTHGIDHWGYWNGGTSEVSSILPEVTLVGFGDETITGTTRDANPSICMQGLLHQITYPTGGYSLFQYEGNDYSERLQRTSASAFLPGVVTASGNAGGARIKSISDFNGTGTENVREFKYLKDYINNPSSTTSSGFLLDYPKYAYFWSSTIGQAKQFTIKARSSGFHSNYNTSENFINYSEVTEIINGLEYKVHKFSNYDSNPDVNDYHEVDLNPGATSTIDPNYLNVSKNFVGYNFNDRSWDRGKELFTGIYDVNRNPIQSTTNVYNDFDPSNYSVGILAGSGTFAQSYKIYEDSPQINHTTNTLINNGQTITTTQNFTYDNTYKLVRDNTTVSSKGESLKTTYHYPYDMTPGNDPTGVYQAMVSSNMVSPVVEQINFVNGQQELLKRTNYGTFFNNYLPKSIEEQVVNGNVFTNTLFQYDNYRNLLQLQKPGGPIQSYQWGYNKTYPVAQITNAPANDIFYEGFEEGAGNSAVNDCRTGHYSYSGAYAHTLSALDAGKYVLSYWQKVSGSWQLQRSIVTVTGGAYTISLSTGQIDDVRFYPSDALMTTYTYDPLIGITSITDEKGVTNYYEYDTFQRLINVKDKDGNLLKHTDYHYQNQ